MLYFKRSYDHVFFIFRVLSHFHTIYWIYLNFTLFFPRQFFIKKEKVLIENPKRAKMFDKRNQCMEMISIYALQRLRLVINKF